MAFLLNYPPSFPPSYSLPSPPFLLSPSNQTIPVLAPTIQDPTLPPTVQNPGGIPVVQIWILLAGSPEQQKVLIAALIAYLMAYMQQLYGQNVVITTEAPDPINLQRRILQSPPEGRLCGTDAPQDEQSIDLRNYDDVVSTK